jgi:hypothetical protein
VGGLIVVNSPDVTLQPATVADAAVLSRLLELYIHDLSEIFAIEIGADGRFGYPALPLYWPSATSSTPGSCSNS